MSDELDQVNTVLGRMNIALGRLQDVAQGRIYNVGTKVTFNEKFGVVTNCFNCPNSFIRFYVLM